MTTTRRETLQHLVGLAALATTVACGDKDGSGKDTVDTGLDGEGGGEGGGEEGGEEGGGEEGGEEGGTDDTGVTPDCELYLKQTEGPYFLELETLRSEITEGRPGKPLALAITVVEVDSCSPVKDAVVDIWHCDAVGVYSGYPGQPFGLDTTGEIFLRGAQVTGTDGAVAFETIYPGVYPGRTVHIHVKVRVGDRERTGQMYFAQDVNDIVLATDPYTGHEGSVTTNDDEGRSEEEEPIIFVHLTEAGDGFEGTLVIGIQSA